MEDQYSKNKINFDESYFQGEEREGFYIKPMMKRAWAAQLEVLYEIDLICKRNGITYFADWGTLLGAVRHKGFIPWDDDIDISMSRMDYVRFMACARKELPAGFVAYSAKDNYAGTLVARVLNSDVMSNESSFLQRFHGCPYIMGVDIFIYDNIPNAKNEETLQIELLKLAVGLNYRWEKTDYNSPAEAEYRQKLEDICNIKLDDKLPIHQQMGGLIDNICAMYWEEPAAEVTYFPTFTYAPHLRYPKQLFSTIIEVPFENIILPIPAEYDKVLKIEYGDYLTPIKSGSSHNYPVYKEQEKILFDYYKKAGLDVPEMFKE